MKKEAIFEEERLYRYSIKRIWGLSEKKVVFICLNPSTADEYEDDQTLKRCTDFSQRWENGAFGSLEVVNLFAFRTTHPKVLKQSLIDTVGKENNKYILKAVKNANLVVAAWGENGSFKKRDKQVLDLLRNESIQLHCLNILKCKQPKHPSRAGKDLIPIPYPY